MVAQNKTIHCTIITIPINKTDLMESRAERPSELVPWADPYIAKLVRKLQREVRLERQHGSNAAATSSNRLTKHWDAIERNEAEVPWEDITFDPTPREGQLAPEKTRWEADRESP